ncbi:MAG: B12-binding domain-containing radical SAM protein, partial [Elusimicrobia bacterium]|nr:B12-binding domain-containing radical SAM protein [Elusimicrobiota bacterium]
IKLPEVDYSVCGEAEYVFGEMLDRIQDRRPLDDIEGVLTKNNPDKPVKQLMVQNLDELPIIDYKLLPYNKYKSILSQGNPATVMMTSRGCPFNCAYCPQAGTKLRKRDAKLVADEIETYLNLGIKDILFFDELFTLEHKRVKELCDEFLRRKLKFRFNIRTRIKDVNQDIIDLLKKSGCHLIQFGIESGTDRIQKLMNKNLDLEVVRKVISMTRKAGILTYGNFMLGSPSETESEMQQTIDFAIKCKLDFAVFAITLLLPKTDYYEMAFKQNKLKEDFWEKYIANPLQPIENAYWPDFEKGFLEEMDKKAYTQFYFRPWYIWNYLIRILSAGQLRTHSSAAYHILKSFGLRKKLTGK